MVSFLFFAENMHENMGNNKINEKSFVNGGESGMVNQSKYTTALTGGGHEVGNGGGQSTSSPQGGGNGVVPLYAAGAAAQRRNHKGGVATYTPCLKGWFAVLFATSTSILLHIPM